MFILDDWKPTSRKVFNIKFYTELFTNKWYIKSLYVLRTNSGLFNSQTKHITVRRNHKYYEGAPSIRCSHYSKNLYRTTS